MLPTTSPFREEHGRACRLGLLRSLARDRRERSRLYGTRKMRFPLVALTTSRELGPARHALAQRVVAGSFQISYPFKPKPVPRAPSSGP